MPAPALGELLTFQEEYRYEAGEADSKLSCRAVSLLEVKKLLLERLGTYIESTSRVVNLQLASDEVTSLTAGIVKTEILDEQWDGRTYTLIARIQADPEEVNRLIEEVALRADKQEELARLEQLNLDGQVMIERLGQEMAMVQNDRKHKQ